MSRENDVLECSREHNLYSPLSSAGFPLDGSLRSERNFYFCFLISSTREITRQRKIPLRAQNSAQWKTGFKSKNVIVDESTSFINVAVMYFPNSLLALVAQLLTCDVILSSFPFLRLFMIIQRAFDSVLGFDCPANSSAL